MNKKPIKLTEADLNDIVKHSVRKILKEQNMSQEYRNANFWNQNQESYNEVVDKMISTLNFKEQSFLYGMIKRLPNEIIYTLLAKLQHYN